MKKLSYETLVEAGKMVCAGKEAPERVMQFGEGNFLRAFVDYWFDLANEKAGWNGKCLVVKPRGCRPGATDPAGLLNEQEGLYTLYLRGMEQGEAVDRRRIISSVSRCINPTDSDADFEAMFTAAASPELQVIVSNTTEAGIVYDPSCQLSDRPCSSFPGKVTQLLYRRYQAGGSGLILLPCELIDDNGRVLQQCVLQYAKQWGLEEGFIRYIAAECTFCSTLVDRIVTGAVKDPAERQRLAEENGYEDDLAVIGEVFGVWNIEGPDWLASVLPFEKAGVNCKVVENVVPYKKRKVRILNGAHTGFVPLAYLAGYDIVRDCMYDQTIRGFVERMLYEEIIPVLPLPKAELKEFAAAVFDRFCNPYVDHRLLDITLNSTSKWRTRNLPSLLEYVEKYGKLPHCLVTSFAALLAFYTTNVQELTEAGMVCRRAEGDFYTCSDDRRALEFFYAHREDEPQALVKAAVEQEWIWGNNLEDIPGFEELAAEILTEIRRDGAAAAFAGCLKE